MWPLTNLRLDTPYWTLPNMVKPTFHWKPWQNHLRCLFLDTSLKSTNKALPRTADFLIQSVHTTEMRSITISSLTKRSAVDFKMSLMLFMSWAPLMCTADSSSTTEKTSPKKGSSSLTSCSSFLRPHNLTIWPQRWKQDGTWWKELGN